MPRPAGGGIDGSLLAIHYAVMGGGVQYKLISGISIIPDHSIGETTMFPEAFGQTLNWMAFSEMVFTDVGGLSIWFRKITPRHTFYHVVM